MTAFLGTMHFVWKWFSVLVKKVENVALVLLEDNLLLRSTLYSLLKTL